LSADDNDDRGDDDDDEDDNGGSREALLLLMSLFEVLGESLFVPLFSLIVFIFF
jgi:hypothetical protein